MSDPIETRAREIHAEREHRAPVTGARLTPEAAFDLGRKHGTASHARAMRQARDEAISTRYAAAKRIVRTATAEKVEGVLLDTFTASVVVAVFEAMNDTNRARFDSLPLVKLVDFCLSKASA
ncbi:hypothetical protein MRBLMI12_000459 [Microbacterium sp. LMI12-1-1.1]|uniref:hypothetical protein n=1 Tax=Microbacterium sp. LMI12-1-1.1 TaxID=3135225 RepID=UPI00343FB2A0